MPATPNKHTPSFLQLLWRSPLLLAIALTIPFFILFLYFDTFNRHALASRFLLICLLACRCFRVAIFFSCMLYPFSHALTCALMWVYVLTYYYNIVVVVVFFFLFGLQLPALPFLIPLLFSCFASYFLRAFNYWLLFLEKDMRLLLLKKTIL